MSDPSTPTDWQWGPLPQVSGWFAVRRCWDPAEGIFPDAAWVHHGRIAWSNDGGIFLSTGEASYAGPFPTEEEAQAWAEAHDVM